MIQTTVKRHYSAFFLDAGRINKWNTQVTNEKADYLSNMNGKK